MKPHVSEDALLALATLDAADDAARLHLAACAECAGRLDALTRLLADARSGAEDAADAVFTPDRLDRQRDHILRRIDHDGRPARVIEFPHRAAGTSRPLRPVAVRWVAAAAAAGLVIGVYAGTRITPNEQRLATETQLSRLAAPPVPPAQPAPVARDVVPARSDEEILSDVETALLAPRVPQLEAIDALTPRVRERVLKIRY